MAKKEMSGKNDELRHLVANINSLIENDKLILSQFDKLHDEMESLRDDVHEVKEQSTRMSLQLFNVESDLRTVKRLAQEEPEKRRGLEQRIRQILPNLPK